uniref:DNA replication licensing factor MCM4 n=1 Tax=Globisporangium ultimum (strain ATCC 200006 / CBS 805.95 / DAOM BR144) TaxID=431595 RepID=K3WYG0_GLOUD
MLTEDTEMAVEDATQPMTIDATVVPSSTTTGFGTSAARSGFAYNRYDDGRPQSPLSPTSPMSPTSAVSISASAVSATDQPRYTFPEMSASIDATPTPRYLGRFGAGGGYGGGASEPEDDVEAELRRMAQRQLPRGDLGRQEWRLDNFTPHATAATSSQSYRDMGGAPSSPTSSIRSAASSAQNESALPRPPASPPSSPRSRSSTTAGGFNGDDFSASHRSPQTASHMPPDSDQNLSGAVVWGTNISVSESMTLFRAFLHQYQLPGHPPRLRHEEGYYVKVLRQLALTQSLVFNLDTQHLLQFRSARKLYNQLLLFPQVLIRILDMVVSEEFQKLFPEATEEESRLQVRPFNLSDLSPMRNLNPSDIDQLVCLKGMVTRCSAIIPDLKEAFFRCTICHATTQVELDRGRIEEPTYCERCNTRLCMEMIHNRCSFTDKQMVKMQETPDAIPEGETPYTVMLFAFDDLVDDVRPGDKVEVTGIYRAVPLRASSRQRVVKSVFKTYIDVVHFRRVDELARRGDEQSVGSSENGTLADDSNNIQSTEEAKIQKFRQIAAHPNVYENLAHSLAPSIWELDDVKKGILCMLFGGTRKDKAGNTSGNSPGGIDGALMPTKTMRSDMNILLCGDPGTSKSQLLSYVHKLSPRSIYTSGKGSSAVGLTASIIRDMETGDLVLESGALVLSDEGICCIDEFDKMSDSARSVLHEVMEQQTVSIAKAGIICSLNARASILASANPIESRYNPNKSVIENVNILPTLLSRFDLIYLILDKPQAESDRKLAKHIVALYYDDDIRTLRQNNASANGSGPQLISMKLLTEYISYAKKHIQPRLLPEARDALIAAYLDLRRMGGGSAHASKKNITATPRQLESLIRISEALAKMKLNNVIYKHDVDEALRLMNVATQRAAMDPRTGTIDMDMINTGHSTSEREAIADIIDAMKAILSDAPGQSMTVGETRKFLEEKRHGELKGTEFQMALRSLEEDSLIQISHGLIRYFGDAA